MMMGALALSAMAMAVAIGGEGLKSGPQPGTTIPGPFNVLNETGANAGKKNCLV
jgi:hypothetical protein